MSDNLLEPVRDRTSTREERHRHPVRCRFCGGTDGQIVLDLGMQPSCEAFPLTRTLADEPRCPLRMWFCPGCGLAQLAEDPGDGDRSPPGVESVAMRAQMVAALDFVADIGSPWRDRTVVEFGSPHGTSWLPEIGRRGAVVRDARQAGSYDVVLDVFGLLHESDQRTALRSRAAAVAPGGILVAQLHSLATVLSHRETGELRHGHYAYWSALALADALGTLGFGIHRARLFPCDAGTTVVVASRDPRPDASTLAVLERERRIGVDDIAVMSTLQADADRQAAELNRWLRSESRAGRCVAAYGAASRAVPVLCHAGVDVSQIIVVADAARAKQGRHLPGTGIPIVSPAALEAVAPDRVVVTVPALLAEVRESMPSVERRGGRWLLLDDIWSSTSGSHSCAGRPRTAQEQSV